MGERTEHLNLIISGDGKLLGAELDKETRAIKRFGANAGNIFSGINQKFRSSLKNIASNPLTIIGGTGAILYAGRQIMEYNDKLSTLRLNAQKTVEDQLKLDKTISSTALATGQTREKILETLSEIVDKTGDFDFAVASIESLSRASTGMGADLMDTGRLASGLKMNLNATAEEMTKIFDIFATSGNKGSFTFAEMATQSERLLSAATMLNIKKDTFAEYAGFLQYAFLPFGTPEETSTAVKNIAITLQKERGKIRKLLKYDPYDKDGNVTNFSQTIADIVKMSKGDIGVLSKIFGDSATAFGQLNKEFREAGNLNSFNALINAGQQGGFINYAFSEKANEMKFFVNAMAEIGKIFTNAAMNPVIKSLSEELQKITADPEKMEQFVEATRELGENLSYVLTSLIKITGSVNDLLPLVDLIGLFGGAVKDITAPFRLVHEGVDAVKISIAKSKKKDRFVDAYNNMPKEYRSQVFEQLQTQKSVKFIVDPAQLQGLNNNPTAVKNDIYLNVNVAESGRVSTSTSGNANLKFNRGKM